MTSTRLSSRRRSGHRWAAAALWAAMALPSHGLMAQDGPPPLPEGFPVTLPFPEGFQPKIAQRHEQPTIGFLVIGNAPGTVAELADFYRSRLPKRGFEIVREDTALPSTIVLNFDAPGLDYGSVGLVEASGVRGETTLTVSLSYDREEQ